VNMAKRKAFFLGRLHTLGDPAFEFLDGLAADGELDEMKRHALDVSAQDRFLKGSLVRG
jgi:hypothetical protein